MKKKLLSLALACCAFMTALAAGPQAEFPEKEFDFGTIAEDAGPVSHDFTFTNTGDAPLMIVNVRASCGCTRPEFPKKPIKAGKSDKVKVTFLPVGRPGEFNKTVTIKTNAGKGKKVVLRIKGFVTPAKK